MDKKERRVGTVSRGIRCPIIREGDDLAAIVTESVLEAAASEGFELRDRDVISITESIVARAQGNYASVEDIAEDVRTKLGGGTIGVLFPIFSRNRFAICLRGIAKGAKKIVLMLSYPSDEVGNHLMSLDKVPAFSLSSFIFIKRLFSSSSLSAISVVSFTYLRLMIFLQTFLISVCDSSSLTFHMMYFAYKLNEQGDNIQP